jgi:hypothetical protein
MKICIDRGAKRHEGQRLAGIGDLVLGVGGEGDGSMNEKKPRRDGQKSGLAGELFVAAELLKREYQVSLTLGNAKSVDLFVQKHEKSRALTVQVKTLRSSNCYLIGLRDVHPEQIYVFVLLHRPGEPVEYFMLSGQYMIDHPQEIWGAQGGVSGFAGITMGRIRRYKDNWEVFDESTGQTSLI